MTIKEIEQLTGLTRSNIRFYEKEKLICPRRNAGNGYREYSGQDVENIRKIAYLRTLGIPVGDIRRILNKEADLYDVVREQEKNLAKQLSDLENAKIMCERMLASDEKITYEDLDIEKYVSDLNDYWDKNSSVFQMDSIRFFYMWGGNVIWAILTIACFLIAAVSIRQLPQEIPVQWSDGVVSSLVNKNFIFAFPVVCIIIRFILRPFIWQWFSLNIISEDLANYITNYLCAVALSVEIFIILYVNEIVKHVTILLCVVTCVFLGLLFMAGYKSTRREK